jgi:hypothetical protein
MDGKTLKPSGMVKLKFHVKRRLIWVLAAVGEMNGFDLLLGNDALSDFRCFSVECNEAGVGNSRQRPRLSKRVHGKRRATL